MTDENRALTFSQRNGYEDLPPQMQLGEISGDLRREIYNQIWRFLDRHTQSAFYGGSACLKQEIELIIRMILGEFLNKPEEGISCEPHHVRGIFKSVILEENFNRVLDLLEMIVNHEPEGLQPQSIAALFEKHAAAYYLKTDKKPYFFFPRTSTQESEATLASLKAIKSASGFDPALTHLNQAAKHLRNNQFADSIHDSISAVESIARKITGENRLSKALKKIEGSGMIQHEAFKEAIIKLYGYTSNEEGIRHALIENNEANVGFPDALFFYNACAAFCGYLATVGNVK